jgi:hypothetical protein
MLAIFTYLQVMPTFLDYLFCYGEQVFEQDFHFSGLHYEPRLSPGHRDLCVPELARSGRTFQICYNLRSVEPAKRQKNWPWSIRSTAVYHSFDVETGLSNWIVVKGSESMKRRMISELDPLNAAQQHSVATLEDAFMYTLSSHLVPCNWAGENWRWYINFMEEEIQKITRRTLTVTVTEQLSPGGTGSEKQSVPPLDTFCFTDLQEIQHIEEKANTTLLVLKLNANVLSTLSKTYQSILLSEDCPGTIQNDCRREVAEFSTNIANIENNLRAQQSRVETLVRLLSDRKALVRISSQRLCVLLTYSRSSTASLNTEAWRPAKILRKGLKSLLSIWKT